MMGNTDRQIHAGSIDSLIVRSNSGDNHYRRFPPSIEACLELQHAYNYFNKALFDGALPQSLITYTRKTKVLGHFCPDRFERSNGEFWPEVALNPVYLALRSDQDSLSTLVHEQCHVWRHYLDPLNRDGKRNCNGYHCRVWAGKMEEAGLTPTDTGLIGGKRTGYHMTHVIVSGGAFDIACSQLLETGFRINWHDRVEYTHSPSDSHDDPEPEPQKKIDRIKFTCPVCGLNAWAKPAARLSCSACNHPMETVSHRRAPSIAP